MDEDKFLDLSIKFLGNELAAVELEEFQRHLKEDQYKKRFDTICEQWNRAADKLETVEFDSYEGFKNFVAKIEAPRADNCPGRRKVRIYNLLQAPSFIRIAASIAFILVVSVILFNSINIVDNKEVSEKWQEKTTKLGERSTLTFQDGTRIVLNADSKLKYRINSNDSTREVYLEGEAYFHVAHDASRPFIVHTDKISTTVLGTKFDVKAFPGEKDIAISLVEGSVKVNNYYTGKNSSDAVILRPREQMCYNKTTGNKEVKQFNLLQVTGWKDNILIFDGVPLDEVFAQLGRAFGVEFEISDDSLKEIKVTANFENEPFWTIVKAIKKVTSLEYKTTNSGKLEKIIFYRTNN